MVVVLPAPLGPRKPKISPRFTSKVIPFTASTTRWSLSPWGTFATARSSHVGGSVGSRAGGRRKPIENVFTKPLTSTTFSLTPPPPCRPPTRRASAARR